MDEATARRIFEAAITGQRCAETLECLFDGGSVTVDPDGNLVLLRGDALADLFASQEETE